MRRKYTVDKCKNERGGNQKRSEHENRKKAHKETKIMMQTAG
jgi:hypothetical protein